ncbi:DUF6221 family protein [Nocardia stercoris]|uniref:Uncharacterized protein n=1 Tax=Nocardia stercoris TaxID=2483361 RepID=A0A3M2L079_9NOCA|nr:DUF6221 family protein [Nocardia stercoris]RMI30110.1 hypothetical protein EBN03_23070 [Nocardia stercoris]
MTIDDFIDARVAEIEQAALDAGGEPDRVLADCKAKRRIVAFARYAQTIAYGEGHTQGDPSYRLGQWHGYKAVLVQLASIWSDHPDFRTEWAADALL